MSRQRLTITIKDQLLKLLDSTIDGQKIRNRSHAVEVLLSQNLLPKDTKVLILAGGKPVFFESENKALPKAMVKIAGKPLLEHTLQKLKNAKFNEIIISLGEGGESIKTYFKDGSAFGLNIKYTDQNQAIQGTAQPLLQAKKHLSGQEFLVVYGDVLTDIDYSEFVEFHRAQKTAICTMALCSVENVNMWGLAKLKGNKIMAFEEKPQKPKTFSKLINAGLYVMSPEIFKFTPPAAVRLESDVFPRLADEQKLFGYPYEGLWLDISSSAAYKEAVAEMTKLT